MGKLEREAAQAMRITKTRLAILSTIKVAGLISMVLIAPNVAGILARAMNRSHFNSTRSSVKRLRDAGLVEMENEFVRLTPKGERFLLMHLRPSEKKPKWDGFWRVVIFDVPEQKRIKRQRLRSTLLSLGFLKLQNSVWISPYDREDLVALIKSDLRMGRDVLYMVVHKIENDGWMRRHFGLK